MTFKLFNLFRRGKAWKTHVEQNLLSLRDQIDKADLTHANRSELEQLSNEITQLLARIDTARDTGDTASGTADVLAARLSARQRFLDKSQARTFAKDVIIPLSKRIHEIEALGDSYEALLSRRSSELVILFLTPDDPERPNLGGANPVAMLDAVLDGVFRAVIVIVPDGTGGQVLYRADELLAAVKRMPAEALSWADIRRPRTSDPDVSSQPASSTSIAPDRGYFIHLEQILADIERLDFHALGALPTKDGQWAKPFDEPDSLPTRLPAQVRKKSALFLHNSYYHFNCLSAGLRQRGWDTLTVSLESPESAQRQFYHGEDLNLFDPDPLIMSRKTREFFRTIPERYGALQFCGQGSATLFPSSVENSERPRLVPWDFLELRRHQLVIGYTPSGCQDGGLQSSIRELTNGVCGRCVWELRPDVCSDARSLAWNRKLALLCNWVGLECDHATSERIGDKTVYGPVVTALDPDRWRPDIVIPEDMRIERQSGQILVYHAVGNYAARRTEGRDIKGTGVIMAAIDQLQAEGLPVRLVFAHNVPSNRIRFLQVQADIVIDQLNYGRYGANARESIMLGKPTICHLNPIQSPPLPPLRPIIEAPIIDATEASITDVLRALVLNPDQRTALGERARTHALAWHGKDACAERYERVIDRIRAGLLPESPDLYPPARS